MALLRFRFPWGLLLTVLSYAALAGAAGWFLSTDLHGLLWLRSALQAGGGAVLGAVAWRISERLTDWVNLHTLPLLRLGVAGIAAVILATFATDPFCELGVGTGLIWPEALCSVLFFVAALAPMIAGVTLVAGLETMLAARRGGGGVGAALKPIWRHLAAGLVLGAVTAYAAVELRSEIQRGLVSAAPDRVRASGWIEAEKRLFRAVHEGWGCEILVVPFAAGEPSVDRPARSLMTRYVAAEVAARSGKCVADPTLVMRALGTRARAADDGDIRALAEAMNARWVLHGSVTRDPDRLRIVVSLRLDQRRAPDTWTAGQPSEWGPLEFSDDLPPEAAFDHIAREVAEGLGLELAAAPEPQAAEPHSTPLSTTPVALASAAETPLQRARGLQLLAALHPLGDVDGEHLWERSLVALRPLAASDEVGRMLRARAALHLYRRPYAVGLLQGLAAPEAQALFALAQGNLALIEPLARAVKDPAGELTLKLEIEALRARYGKTAGLAQRRSALLDGHPGYSALLSAALSQGEADPRPALQAIRAQLNADGVEVPQNPLQALGSRVGLSLGDDAAGIAAAIQRSRERAWRTRAAAWRGQTAYDRVAAWDAEEALYAAARGVVTGAGWAQARAAQQSDSLVAFVRSLDPAYGGYPPLLAGVAAGLRAGTGGDALRVARAQRLPRDVLAWEGGESDTERLLRAQITSGLPPPPPDEPPRPWRRPNEATGSALQLARLQAYSHDAFEPLEQAVIALEEAEQTDQALRLREEARLRFIGSAARERFLMRRAEETGNLAALGAVLLEHIGEQPDDWPAYVRLAGVYLNARQAAHAQQTLAAFPSSPQADAAAATQRAYEAGMLLFDAGEAELARPFLVRAAAGADSPAMLWSRLAVSLLDGNWKEVQARAVELHEKHEAPGALTRAATVSFLLGENDAGWRTFYEAAKRFENFGPWAAALAGHRIERTKPAEVIAFAERWKSLSGQRPREIRLRGYFLFNALLIDRAPDAPLAEELGKLAEKWQDREFGGLVAGYHAFRRGEHASAADRLLPLYDQSARRSTPHLLPYLTVSLARAGRLEEAQALIAAARQQAPRAFHGLLATAYLAGARGRADEALQLLWEAFVALPPREENVVPAGFQLLEISEQLYGLSGDDRYRALLVDLARRQQRVWPVSWAYTFDARYSPRSEEADAALAAALFLDPESERVRHAGADQRKRAEARYPSGNPFKRG
jgi:hypothetical protein